jgi:hypothetical protein
MTQTPQPKRGPKLYKPTQARPYWRVLYYDSTGTRRERCAVTEADAHEILERLSVSADPLRRAPHPMNIRFAGVYAERAHDENDPSYVGCLTPVQRDALWRGCVVTMDELFDDHESLTRWTDDVQSGKRKIRPREDILRWSNFLSRLPQAYADHYTVPFVRSMILCAGSVGQALASGHTIKLTCTAEELILDYIIDTALSTLDDMDEDFFGGLEPDPGDRYSGFRELVFDDFDCQNPTYSLGEQATLAVAANDPSLLRPVEQWFEPFCDGDHGVPHPYCND